MLVNDCSVAIFVFSVTLPSTLACFWNLTNLALTDELCSNTDSVSATLNDYGLFIRTALLSINMDNCINCGIATSRCNITGRRPLDEESILSIVRAWVAPRTVDPSHHLCQACWDLAAGTLMSHKLPEIIPGPRGHIHVCINCGRSLLRKVRSHRLRSNSEREQRILNVISEWILPRTVGALSAICHSCWVRADRAARHFVSQPSTSASGMPTSPTDTSLSLQPTQETPKSEIIVSNISIPTVEINKPAHRISQDTIILPDYLRPIQTESKCFIGGCNRTERNRIPIAIRRNLLNLHNYYVPQSNRLCDYHLNAIERSDLLIGLSNNSINTFTASHIQDMLALKSPTVT